MPWAQQRKRIHNLLLTEQHPCSDRPQWTTGRKTRLQSQEAKDISANSLVYVVSHPGDLNGDNEQRS